MTTIKSFLRRHIYELVIGIVAVLIIVQSYAPGTILSGWDALHPEFNIGLYFQRIFSVWQSHQGLGAPPSQAHSADAVHALIIALLNVVFPVTLVRYIFILSMLLLGPLGVFYFAKHILFKTSGNPSRYAFVAGFVYLLHPLVAQHFYTPLEMFVVLYGIIGWFFLALLSYLQKGTKKQLLIFGIVIILLSPIAHTPTLWYVFFGFIVLFLTVYWAMVRSRTVFIRCAVVGIIMVLLNLFWILPNVYYVRYHNSDVRQSKTHRLLSNEFFWRSQKRGTLPDTIMLTNFPFDWTVYNAQTGGNEDQMGQWKNHVVHPLVQTWGALLFVVGIIGMVYALKKKNTVLVAFIPIALLSIFFLRNANPPFTSLFLALRSHFELVGEGFRFPFTKVSLQYFFVYVCFIAYGYMAIEKKLLHLSKHHARAFSRALLLWFACMQILFAIPALVGGYVSPFMKVTIPQDYFSLFKWFDGQKQGRILRLPMPNPHGWVYHNWGYQGAGFLWFGLKQPLLDREFDRWYWYNEQAYRELSYALYSRNPALFSKVLKKYNVSYILNDTSVVYPDAAAKNSIFTRETNEVLSGLVDAKKAWESGPLRVYSLGEGSFAENKSIDMQTVGPTYDYTFMDTAITTLPYTTIPLQNSLFYPFRSFIKKNDKLIDALQLDLANRRYSLSIPAPANSALRIPNYREYESSVYASVYAKKVGKNVQLFIRYFVPSLVTPQDETVSIAPSDTVTINGEPYVLKNVPTIGLPAFVATVFLPTREESVINEYRFIPSFETRTFNTSSSQIDIAGSLPESGFIFTPRTIEQNSSEYKTVTDESIQYALINGSTGSTIYLPALSQDVSYALSITSSNQQGLPMRLCVRNLFSQRCDIEDELSAGTGTHTDTYVLPAMRLGSGYQIEFQNYSLGNMPTINGLHAVEIMPFPADFLSAIQMQQQGNNTVKVLPHDSAYEEGWFAFQDGKKLEHVLVNNWANAWVLRQGSGPRGDSITIIFWPQYLEYAGFMLVIVVFAVILIFPNKGRKEEGF